MLATTATPTLPTRARLAVLVAGAALLVAAGCSGTTTPDTSERPASTTTTAPVVAADAVGPFKVGRRTVEMVDSARHRTLTVDVWYPADPSATGSLAHYSFLPNVGFDSKLAIDSPPVSSKGPFPLVVYSHGSGGQRYVATFFTETLASHGFVVAAPDHTGNTAFDSVAGTDTSDEQTALNRVNDVDFVITDMLARNAKADDPFKGSVDPDRIALTGHSFGGFTALAAPVGYSNAAGNAAADPRIKAVVAMAPYSTPIDDAHLAELNVPTLLMTGTRDVTTPIDPQTERPWAKVAGRPLYRVDITNAAHQSFTDVCDYQKMIPTFPDAPKVLIDAINDLAKEGCPADFLDVGRVHQIANTFAISFLETELAGVKGYESVLTEKGAAKVPEVVFSSKAS